MLCASRATSSSIAWVCVAAISLSACTTLGKQTTIDLVDEFRFAESHIETREISFGTAAARLHLKDGWSQQEELWAGRFPFVWAVGGSSTVRFWDYNHRSLRFDFTCAPPPGAEAQEQTVSVSLNGVQIGKFALEPGFHEYSLPALREVLVTGENRLRFDYADIESSAKRVERRDSRDLAVAWKRIVFSGAARTRAPTITEVGGLPGVEVPFFSEVSYYVEVAPGAVLEAESVRLYGSIAGASRPELDVAIEFDGNAVPISERVVPEVKGEAFRLKIPVVRASPARIRLTARAETASREASGGVHVVAPRVVLPALDASPGTTPKAANRAEDSAYPGDEGLVREGVSDDGPYTTRPSVIVYLIDTLRADHLGTYGYDRPVSPMIDNFAKEVVVFERAFAHSSWTRTSVASLFTGLLPRAHGIYGREDSIAKGTQTLARLFKLHGYETFGAITNGIVSPKFGFDIGFDTYQYLGEQKTEAIHQYSDRVNQVFFDWLAERRGESPFFAYLHTMDPHSPYTPPKLQRSQFAGNIVATGLTRPRDANRLLAEREELTREQVNSDLIDLYDAEIAFNDHQFGLLLQGLKERGLYDSSLIVLLSDHGEEFLDHGRWEHLKTLYRELIHVPLLMKVPGGGYAGHRVRMPVQLVDLMPSLLEATGADVPEFVQGTSVWSLLDGMIAPYDNRPILSFVDVDGNLVESMVVGPKHVLRYPNETDSIDGHRVQLFNLDTDWSEQEDWSHRYAVQAGVLLTRLKKMQIAQSLQHSPETAVIDPELAERLRAVGYIQ